MARYRTEIVRDGNLPYEEITELLHLSYAEHLQAGRNYAAAVQDVETTKKRLEGHIVVLMYEGDTLVGTSSYKQCYKKPGDYRKWYQDDYYVEAAQTAIHPDHRTKGAFMKMALVMFKMDEIKNCDAVMADTSVEAEELIKGYLNMGMQIVDMVSWPNTNYYSYIFRRPIKGERIDEKLLKKKMFWAKLKCKIRYSKTGRKRF